MAPREPRPLDRGPARELSTPHCHHEGARCIRRSRARPNDSTEGVARCHRNLHGPRLDFRRIGLSCLKFDRCDRRDEIRYKRARGCLEVDWGFSDLDFPSRVASRCLTLLKVDLDKTSLDTSDVDRNFRLAVFHPASRRVANVDLE